jgi:hypothetical protein
METMIDNPYWTRVYGDKVRSVEVQFLLPYVCMDANVT